MAVPSSNSRDQLPGLGDLTLQTMLWMLAIGWGAYLIGLGVYRLYIHPLANVPGPKIAAITQWYELYYDVWQSGQYFLKVEEFHKQYGTVRLYHINWAAMLSLIKGPIVRIKPNEVHCNDPEFVDVLFAGPLQKRDKDPWLPRSVAVPLATAGTIPHDLHRSRRAPLNPYFSKQSVRKREYIFQEILKKLLRRFEEHRETGAVLTLNEAIAAAATDIVASFCFGRSTDCTDRKDFSSPFFQALDKSFKLAHIMANFGLARAFMTFQPPQLVAWMTPALAPLFELHQVSFSTEIWSSFMFIIIFFFGKGILTASQQWNSQIRNAKAPTEKHETTIFNAIMEAKLPPFEKSFQRLHQEAKLIVLAGFSTTGEYPPLYNPSSSIFTNQIFPASTVSPLIYELLANPDKLNKLRTELLQALPNPDSAMSLSELEKLPYLSAVIQEGIRMHPGGILRMQRISPDKPLSYTDPCTGTTTTFPPGTSISMDALSVNMNPDLFPNPSDFVPERWLESPQLSRYLLSFSKGTRICLGINVAHCMLYYFVAGIFRNYGLPTEKDDPASSIELYETERKRDVDVASEFIIPAVRKESKGIRVLLR
ncbi:cytochrome P450 [Aspergillus affinis]|uniref:cytochrome P450 n=1 Tax=Aspergillus affinis TaxID=1070780 RepID=UPI0022FE5D82|nr:cytochrome p450 [Aspergillus affinis]KAI9042963.1 cytochrome p450 [Aspergillus affinis]